MNPSNKTTPKDFFIHLGATIALYVSVGALINLLFSLIDYVYPDVISSDFFASSIALPISILVVLVPIFYLLVWLIQKDTKQFPEKDDLWIKKWRVFLTLFISGAVVAGDLIALINTYLNGEISTRFVWKFLVILIILGIIFTYYLLEKVGKDVVIRNAILYSGIVIVLASIISGFLIVGSPSRQRALRFDSIRVAALTEIQNYIVNYWQAKRELPKTLSVLNDPLIPAFVPVDPETQLDYEYSIKADKTFELCATFSEVSDSVNDATTPVFYDPSDKIFQTWKHEAGRVCFTRTIDPEKYPPFPKNK
jgi:hypothetical protein